MGAWQLGKCWESSPNIHTCRCLLIQCWKVATQQLSPSNLQNSNSMIHRSKSPMLLDPRQLWPSKSLTPPPPPPTTMFSQTRPMASLRRWRPPTSAAHPARWASSPRVARWVFREATKRAWWCSRLQWTLWLCQDCDLGLVIKTHWGGTGLWAWAAPFSTEGELLESTTLTG